VPASSARLSVVRKQLMVIKIPITRRGGRKRRKRKRGDSQAPSKDESSWGERAKVIVAPSHAEGGGEGTWKKAKLTIYFESDAKPRMEGGL